MVDFVISGSKLKLGLFIVFLPLMFGSVFGCTKITPRPEAEKIAKKALARYCRENNVPFEKFCDGGVASQPDFPWVFHFLKNESPKHKVDVIIDWYGNAETNFKVEEQP